MKVVNGKRQAALFTTEVEGPFAVVVFNGPVEAELSYRIPARLEARVRPGQRVRVPLGRANAVSVGYCVRVEDTAEVEPGRVKDVLDALDDPPLIGVEMLELTRWMAGYYACSWGQALEAALPAGVKKQAGTRLGTFLVVPEEVRETLATLSLPPKQAEILAILCQSSAPLSVADACRLAHCTTGPIAALKTRGLLHTVRRRVAHLTMPASVDVSDEPPAPVLTGEQRGALDKVSAAIDAGGFSAFVLHGVTGSGKTEVYLSAIEHVVAQGREAIVLVPEISLTPQTIRRFQRRIPRVAVLHSHLSDAERHHHWRSIANGEVPVVVGARSAVFAPTRKLGLIVVDEEHESTFKQETAPRYHGRDVAVKRAQLEGVPIVLGSATPALETWHNVERGRYTRLELPRRVNNRPMPRVQLIDLRHEKPESGKPSGALSPTLRTAMEKALDDGGQVILLLNRRGFHTFVLCPRCGNVLKCDACDVTLTYHRGQQRLLCHICDAERALPPACPACQAPQLHYGGIGTERLEREVRASFPDHVARRMDSDTMRTPGSHEQVLAAFRSGDVRILLGTQMIAKGLDFPGVTLVGVVNADTALHLPDFRAAERTFQLVAQVAGRTGRGDRPGRVLVQTYCPDNAAILFAAQHDYHGFAASELPIRKRFGFPPYSRLVRLIARGADEAAVKVFTAELASIIKSAAPPTLRLLGPAPAPILKIRNLHRYHLQLRAPAPAPLQNLLRAVLPALVVPQGIELAVDVDPVSLL